MTVYSIEVRAIAEQYDILARQVAREILQLPGRDDHQSLIHQHLSVHTAQLYHLTGDLSPSQLDQLTHSLLIDPVTQTAIISSSTRNQGEDDQGGGRPGPYPAADQSEQLRTGYGPGLSPPWSRVDANIVDVFFHAGVTDTLAESVITGASMLGISGIEQVSTGRRYYLDSRLSADEVRQITESLLYNPVIQNYVLHPVGTRFIASSNGESLGAASEVLEGAALEDAINRVPTSGMSDEQLLDLSKQGLLALNLDEMRTIQHHFREQGREPTDVELETLAQTWSEHCSHKTFKATIEYREVDANGRHA